AEAVVVTIAAAAAGTGAAGTGAAATSALALDDQPGRLQCRLLALAGAESAQHVVPGIAGVADTKALDRFGRKPTLCGVGAGTLATLQHRAIEVRHSCQQFVQRCAVIAAGCSAGRRSPGQVAGL